jgi:hypothetical protein
MLRIFNRSQAALRSFLGLGSSQFSFNDTIIPTFDVWRFLRGRGEQTQTSLNVAVIAPGAVSQIGLTAPGAGTWFLHAISIESAGPLTSGSWRYWFEHSPVVQLPNSSSYGLDSRFDSIPRVGGGIVKLGLLLPTPLLVYSTVATSELINCWVFNDTASVGNLSATLRALWTQTELAP